MLRVSLQLDYLLVLQVDVILEHSCGSALLFKTVSCLLSLDDQLLLRLHELFVVVHHLLHLDAGSVEFLLHPSQPVMSSPFTSHFNGFNLIVQDLGAILEIIDFSLLGTDLVFVSFPHGVELVLHLE